MPRRNPLQDEVDYLQDQLAKSRVANSFLEHQAKTNLATIATLAPLARRGGDAHHLLLRFNAPHRHGPTHPSCWRCDRDAHLGSYDA